MWNFTCIMSGRASGSNRGDDPWLNFGVGLTSVSEGGTLNPSYLLERRLRRTSEVEIGAAVLAHLVRVPMATRGATAICYVVTGRI